MIWLLACAEPIHVGLNAAKARDIFWSPSPEVGSVLRVQWHQTAGADTQLEFEFGDERLASPLKWRDKGEQAELILGVPYAKELRFRVVTDGNKGIWHEAETAALPGGIPEPELLLAGDYEEDQAWLLAGIGVGGEGWDVAGFWKLIFDRKGRVVWAHYTPDENRTFYMTPSVRSGTILWDVNTFWTAWDDGLGSEVRRMYIDGTEVERIPVPGMHHAFVELPDGTIAWGATPRTGARSSRRSTRTAPCARSGTALPSGPSRGTTSAPATRSSSTRTRGPTSSRATRTTRSSSSPGTARS